jgi:NAD/NADP transhydrogenase beta subunit
MEILSGEKGYRLLVVIILVIVAALAIVYGLAFLKSTKDERKFRSQAAISILVCAFATMLSMVTPNAITPTIGLYGLVVGYFFGRAK